ncbi:adenylyl-sulfate kinase [Aquimarina sp. 2201CG14-23]|uniref:adenylyl-sulfate kinase n=1 Tax=Aquimarina mycalae TaxID=3040073 RepID=UPI002477FA3E|nr:adenylyl-sulfate kinase [Aquimarina sp. 2201CG14-23]MDH7448054.1 adenylyl-sulfate kinase [Aquimarina sp. 2201CG14-23]
MDLKPVFILFTGFSGSGKTTLSNTLTSHYKNRRKKVVHLDGDYLRKTSHNQLGFSREDRRKQLLQTGELALQHLNQGSHVIASLIAPYDLDRSDLKTYINTKGFKFILIYIDCPIHICIQRDPKGLYKKVSAGEIKNFTGIDAPYDIPKEPDLLVSTHILDQTECISKIINANFISF